LFFNFLVWLRKWSKKGLEIKPMGKRAKLYKFMKKYVPDFSDDIEDGLSSSKNRNFLKKLLRTLAAKTAESDRKAILLSGDIHVGGISEIFVKSDDKIVTIPQIVSSPIGYEPMPKIAKDFTSEETNIILDVADISATNIFYRSDRNFAIIKPYKLDQTDGIEFVFESLHYNQKFPAYFSDIGSKKVPSGQVLQDKDRKVLAGQEK